VIKSVILLDGEKVSANESFLHSLTPGFLSGKGVFESMRSYRRNIFAIDMHLSRLARGLNQLKIKLPFTRKKLKEQLHHSLVLNRLQEARLRLIIWREKGRVHTAVSSFPYRSYPAAKYKRGYSALISDQRHHGTTKSTNIKSIE